MSLGGGGSRTKSRSKSESEGFDLSYQETGSQSGSYLDQQQAAAQGQLQDRFFSPGEFARLRATPGLQGNRQEVVGDFRRAGNQLGNVTQNLRRHASQGRNMLQQFGEQANPYLQGQIRGMVQDAGQMFREQILPGIGSNAQLAGQRGSSRQGIAEGLAAQRSMQELMQGVQGLRSQAYGMQQQAATNYANLGNQAMFQGYQGQLAAAQGMGGASNQFAQTGLYAAQQPFVIGSQVVGAPSVLNQSSSYGYGMGLGYDTSRSESTSRGESANFEFGL